MIYIKHLLITSLLIHSVYCFINPNPFNSVSVGINSSQDFNDLQFRNFYKPKAGICLDLGFPFHFGYLIGNVNVNIYKRIQNIFENNQNLESQNFFAIHPYIMWGEKFKLTKKIVWFNGVGLGAYIFHYQKNWGQIFTLGPYTETELSLGVASLLYYQMKKKYSLIVGIKKHTIFTYHKISVLSFSVGINKSFTTPDWLEVMLK